MGQGASAISQEDLDEYQDCTFFTKKEILHVHKRFLQLSQGRTVSKIECEVVSSMPELQSNPFCDRMCQVFSEDGSGDMSFEDFLDMMSVFSEGATRDVKASYAFRIYDFDDDGYLGWHDLLKTVHRLVGGNDNLNQQEMEEVVEEMLNEADLDGDRRLSFVEFEHIVSRAPDFCNTFRIRC